MDQDFVSGIIWFALGVALSIFVVVIPWSDSTSYTLFTENGAIYQNGLSRENCELINTKFKLNGICIVQ